MTPMAAKTSEKKKEESRKNPGEELPLGTAESNGIESDK